MYDLTFGLVLRWMLGKLVAEDLVLRSSRLSLSRICICHNNILQDIYSTLVLIRSVYTPSSG